MKEVEWAIAFSGNALPVRSMLSRRIWDLILRGLLCLMARWKALDILFQLEYTPLSECQSPRRYDRPVIVR